MPSPPDRERFLIDTDVAVELILLLRKLGFSAKGAHTLPVENKDLLFMQ